MSDWRKVLTAGCAVVCAVLMVSILPASPAGASTQSFSNTTPVVGTAPNAGPFGGEPGCPTLSTPYNETCKPTGAVPWPSAVTVSDVAGVVTDVKVTLHGFWHKFPADADLLLVGPDDTTMTILMSDACGGSSTNINPIDQASAVTLTFANGSPTLPADSACTTGVYSPVDDDILLNPDGTAVNGDSDNGQFPFICCDSFAAVGPVPPGAPTPPNYVELPAPTGVPPDPDEHESLEVFNGIDPNGAWKLYMVDDSPQTAGSAPEGGLTGGWSLEITTGSAPSVSPVGVFRPSDGVWFFHNGPTVGWGTAGDIPVPADYDGDGDLDVAVFRPAQGIWFIQGGATTAWGTQGDIPVPGDYDDDGDDDLAVFRPSTGTWFVMGGDTMAWGTDGDIPVPADYDGDGATDMAVFRPSSGYWFVMGGDTVAWGTSGDIPAPADYDDDGDADMAVFRPSTGTWFVLGGDTAAWGTADDIPVPADYDGDGDGDIAVFRPSTGYWFVMGGETVPWGTSGDIPLPLPAAIYGSFFA